MRSEISRRNFHVKRTSILATIVVAISLFSSSCGTGDKIGSVSLQVVGDGTGTIDLYGLGGTLQLQVLSNYTSGKEIDETNFATFTVVAEGYYTDYSTSPSTNVTMPTPPQTITINNTGMLTAVDPGVCSWISTTGDVSTPGWAFTGWYEVTATYRGFTTNPVYIPLASAASGQPGMEGECGPQPTT
jgi:hypothetical protein